MNDNTFRLSTLESVLFISLAALFVLALFVISRPADTAAAVAMAATSMPTAPMAGPVTVAWPAAFTTG